MTIEDERRIEELVKERDKAQADAQELRMQSISDVGQYQENFERAEAAEALVTTLKAEVEELKRERRQTQLQLAELADIMGITRRSR